ncbi:hypothetical protein [Hanstruepera ponticola]|uniref:hypothetical protein n=1 Tax=Hanstruepera ponticola TaxID=2042995 RepID=UPI000CF101FB|nr:hypothetical protein [Hanstruepera ponticola]
MKSLLSFIIIFVILSCSEDDSSNNNPLSVVPIFEFVEGLGNNTFESNGSTYTDIVSLHIVNYNQIPANTNVEINITIDNENSTAIEGVDFNFNSGIYIFNSSNNFIQPIPVDIIPNLAFEDYSKTIAFVANLVGSELKVSKSYTISFNCHVDLTGTYHASNDWDSEDGIATISLAENGKWYISDIGGYWQPYDLTINPGYIVVEDCNRVPFSDDTALAQFDTGVVLSGTWDQENGILIMNHVDNFFNGGPYYWTSTYVRQ